MEINITLISVLLIILLFIPGFFFKRFYYIGQFTKQFSSGSFAERFVTNIFWGLVVQVICFSIASRFIKSDYQAIREAVNNYYAELSNSKLPNCSPEDLKHAMIYVVFCVVVAMILGAVLHHVVRILRIDRQFTVLRFANYWNYYFRGDIKGIRRNHGRVISTVLDLLVEDKTGKTRMYQGFLTDYNINVSSGELEIIALARASRYSHTKQSFVDVPGDALIIPYSTVINMNVTYNVVPRNIAGKAVNAMVLVALLSYVYGVYFVLANYPHQIGWFKSILATIVGFFINVLFVANVIVVFEPPQASRSAEAILTVTQKFIATVLMVSMMSILSYCIVLLIRA